MSSLEKMKFRRRNINHRLYFISKEKKQLLAELKELDEKIKQKQVASNCKSVE